MNRNEVSVSRIGFMDVFACIYLREGKQRALLSTSSRAFRHIPYQSETMTVFASFFMGERRLLVKRKLLVTGP